MADEFCTAFEGRIPTIKEQMARCFSEIHKRPGATANTIWESYQSEAIRIICEIMKEIYADAECITNDNQYPDLEIRFSGHRYAFEIKAASSKSAPAFDIRRIPAYLQEDLELFSGDYIITIKHKGRDSLEFQAVYIEPTYATVGRTRLGGAKYQKYSWKVRPKGWASFAAGNGRGGWTSKKDLRDALRLSMGYATRIFIRENYPLLNEEERAKVKRDIANIEEGNALDDLREERRYEGEE